MVRNDSDHFSRPAALTALRAFARLEPAYQEVDDGSAAREEARSVAGDARRLLGPATPGTVRP